MDDIHSIDYRDITAGDAAVDGLAGGVFGGLLMVVYLEIAGLLLGNGPGAMLSRFNPQAGDPLLIAFLLHLAVAGVYGILFGVLYRWLALIRKDIFAAGSSATLGAIYGVLLLLLARGVLLPRSDSALMEIPLLHFGVAHLIFGVSIALVTYRNRMKAVR